MSLQLMSNTLAIGPNLTTPFSASGGTPPYAFSVVPGGAGGVIDQVTGIYTSPSVTGSDVVKVTDSIGAASALTVMVGNALMLFCDIIQMQLNLSPGRVYLWDQKVSGPTDSGLYVVVGELSCKPFGNSNRYKSSGVNLNSVQTINMFAALSVDIMSRGPDARDRKEEIILALKSQYAESQMELNSFFISQISSGFVNLSDPDGDAIPYRFNITVNIQYAITKTNAVPYYNTFAIAGVLTDQ